MKRSNVGLFFSQFVEQFHTTGSIIPSSRFLARELARHVPREENNRRILEVGPGTGAVTDVLIHRLGPADHLDVVELNGEFVDHLHRCLEERPDWRKLAAQVRILHQPVQQLEAQAGYDRIISGLPLNNFSAELVRELLATLRRHALPGAIISFFEYIGVRSLRGTIARGAERQRLQGISAALEDFLQHEIARVPVWRNFPPAWVHHVHIE